MCQWDKKNNLVLTFNYICFLTPLAEVFSCFKKKKRISQKTRQYFKLFDFSSKCILIKKCLDISKNAKKYFFLQCMNY